MNETMIGREMDKGEELGPLLGGGVGSKAH